MTLTPADLLALVAILALPTGVFWRFSMRVETRLTKLETLIGGRTNGQAGK